MDSSAQQMSDLDDVELYSEKDQLRLDAVFRLGKDTPSSSLIFNDFETGSMVGIPILVDRVQNKDNSPPRPITTVSEIPT